MTWSFLPLATRIYIVCSKAPHLKSNILHFRTQTSSLFQGLVQWAKEFLVIAPVIYPLAMQRLFTAVGRCWAFIKHQATGIPIEATEIDQTPGLPLRVSSQTFSFYSTHPHTFYAHTFSTYTHSLSTLA